MTCRNLIDYVCSQKAHEHLKLSWEDTNSCLEKSFSAPNTKWHFQTTTNSIIEAEISFWKEFGTMVYPAIVINRRSYRGQIEPLSVFNAICAAFKEAPDQCAKTLHRAPNEPVAVLTNSH